MLRALTNRLTLLVVRAAAHHVKCFLVRTRKSDADDPARCRYYAEMLSGFVKNLHALARTHVQSSLRIDRHTIPGVACRERCEIAAVGEHAGSLHIESHKLTAIGDVENLIVRLNAIPLVRMLSAITLAPF